MFSTHCAHLSRGQGALGLNGISVCLHRDFPMSLVCFPALNKGQFCVQIVTRGFISCSSVKFYKQNEKWLWTPNGYVNWVHKKIESPLEGHRILFLFNKNLQNPSSQFS
jgi:hypothetical protein